jgi:phosphohistidine phosphatase
MRLYVVRHGKAERDSASGRDEDRALNRRGEHQAACLGESIARLPAAERPSLILSSPARRARDTARIIHTWTEGELRLVPDLGLGAAPADVLDLVIRESAAADVIMIVGHNPTFESLVSMLLSGSDDGDTEMRTGEAAVLETTGRPSSESTWRLVSRLRLED